MINVKFIFTGDSIVLWKQGERVLSAGPIQVRKDFRMTLVEAASLRITNVHVSDTGKFRQSHCLNLIFLFCIFTP